MKKNDKGALVPFYNAEDVLQFIPQLKKLANISVVKLANVDSSNIDPAFWSLLAKTIYEKKNKFDGFVITHGTDTMAYTASAISFALGNFPKPVIFTGAQKPMEDVPSDAMNNLINATIIASGYAVGVAIVFGSKVLQGNRTTKISESSLDAFDSPMVPPLGDISLEPIVTVHANGSISSGTFQPDFDPRIMVIQVTPGLSRFHLRAIATSNIRGLIFEAFGPGNMPYSLVPFLQEAGQSEIPIIVLSQCRKGITRMQLYEVGRLALEAGVIPGGDMTVEAAATKLMWILSQTQHVGTVKELFSKNIAGEITV